MTPELQAAIAEARAMASSSAHEWTTVEIILNGRHEFYTNAVEGFTATLETDQDVDFLTAPFELKEPSETSQGRMDLDFKMALASPDIVDFFNEAITSEAQVLCVYRLFLSTDLSSPAQSPTRLTFSNYRMNERFGQARASFLDLVNKPITTLFYDRERFPLL